MLDKDETSYVFKNAYSYDHNFNFYGTALGEPFLEDGVIVYFDLKVLCVPFFPFGGNDKHIGTRIKQIVSNHRAEVVMYWGCKNLSAVRLNGFKLVATEDFDNPYNVDAYIDLTTPVVLGKDVQRELRKAASNKISVVVNHLPTFGKEHKRLIDEFLRTHKVDFFNRHLIASLKALLPRKTTKVIEARTKNRLVGFSVLDTFITPMPVYLFGFYDRRFYGVSSLIYLKMIEHAKELEAIKLNLGYTIHKTLYDYKKRWPIVISRPVGSNIWESKRGCYKKLVKEWKVHRV